MWDLPGLGIEPAFPALAGGFLTTGPPEKSTTVFESLSCDLLLFFFFFKEADLWTENSM